uniref:Uncharacterized protein n=1 Tax=Arundo donax TaxID=35708 RepID=A0A0A9A6S2_ARUDO
MSSQYTLQLYFVHWLHPHSSITSCFCLLPQQ